MRGLDFDTDGAALHRGAALPILDVLETALADVPPDRVGTRLYGIPALGDLLASGPIHAIAAHCLGRPTRPVRAILFDKTPATNWALGWHQDRTIVVRERRDAPDFGPWTVKAGLQHVEPPFAIIEAMVTLRIHLDDVPANNAPLLIAPGSHRLGRIAEREVDAAVAKCGARTCLASRGDIWVYATPIIHASGASSGMAHRRVIQVDFSAASLLRPLTGSASDEKFACRIFMESIAMALSFHRAAIAFALATPIALAVSASAQAPAGSWRGGSAPDTPIRTTELPPSGAAPASEIADRYLERARTDHANADLWVHCAAAALKRGTGGEADADAYARDMAAIVKPSIHRGAGSPCEDAIPARIWDGDTAPAVAETAGEAPAIGTAPPVASRPAGGGFLVPPEDAVAAPDPGALTPAEEERLRQANAAADAQERARVAAQAAAEQRRAGSQERYDRERAQYEADVAASRAADADYQRQLEERRRMLESGQYRTPQ